ncbi:hypothetical protein KFK09_016637 [Dendrobium nobile]|uniref:Uncharacterized protein n=1 Tax=Dendrobium nobile TaxID=94219 RepID=A0A8T3B164_DENNO|nr:hypothetical protein KFK09_016637 [Dendrobium nobile]
MLLIFYNPLSSCMASPFNFQFQLTGCRLQIVSSNPKCLNIGKKWKDTHRYGHVALSFNARFLIHYMSISFNMMAISFLNCVELKFFVGMRISFYNFEKELICDLSISFNSFITSLTVIAITHRLVKSELLIYYHFTCSYGNSLA